MKKIIIFAALFELIIVPVMFPFAVDREYSLEADADLSLLSFSQLQERIQSEIEFSRCLLKLYPDREQEWEKLIKKAEAIVSGALKTPPYSICHEDVKKAEAVLAPIGKTAKTYTIHCVGHAHIDMNWMWSWPETVAVTNDTFITVLKLMDEFPDFCFTQSQASVYEIVKKYNPELFAGIKKRVAEGRWEIAAVQWVEGDKNLASGESLARHLLYTRHFFKENFNLNAEDLPLDWEPDTFGHAHTIPAIVSRAAVKYYYLCRGGKWKKPPVFWWQSSDGSRILVNLETTWYNDSIGPHNAFAMVKFSEKTGLKDWMNVYGVGDHGGGPTRRDIIRCHEMTAWPIFPDFKLTTTREYYAILEEHSDSFPILDRELNFEFPGCYTSQSQIKKFNRIGENQAVEAETAALLAFKLVGKDYPSQQLGEAWKKILFGHFHDILPGSGVRATRQYQSGLFQQAVAATGMIKTNSLRTIASRINTSFSAAGKNPAPLFEKENRSMGAGAGRGTEFGDISSGVHQKSGPRSIIVFNPTTWKRNEVIQVSIWDSGKERSPGDIQKKDFIVRTSNGDFFPAQKAGSGNYWGHHYIDLMFPVIVGPLGYSSYCIEEGKAPSPSFGKVKLIKEALGFENEFLKVCFDRLTGGIIQLVDKKSGLDLADRDNPMGVLEYILERPGAMSAWVIQDPKARICPLELDALKVVRFNPYAATVQAEAKLNQSEITITYTLKTGRPWLEISVDAFWLERGKHDIGIPTLRMQFPTCLTKASARYEIPFGSIKRSLNKGEEVPGLRWADVSGNMTGLKEKGGLLLLNDCKYGHSLSGSTLRLTLIRSSYLPDPLPELGKHTMRMALVPHGSEMNVGDMVRLGAAFNSPLQIIYTDNHPGSLPPHAGSLISIKPGNVLISCIKKAENENTVIIRLHETDGKSVRARVEVNQSFFGLLAGAEEVDLLERPSQKNTAGVVKGNAFSVDVPAYAIVTVKLSLENY